MNNVFIVSYVGALQSVFENHTKTTNHTPWTPFHVNWESGTSGFFFENVSTVSASGVSAVSKET